MDYRPDKLEQLSEECLKVARAYADYVNFETLFRERAKDFLAALMIESRAQDMSETASENVARATENWIKFREEQFKELKKAGRLKIQYEEAKRKWETERTIQATKREEFKRL